jgi:hypothetical protein
VHAAPLIDVRLAPATSAILDRMAAALGISQGLAIEEVLLALELDESGVPTILNRNGLKQGNTEGSMTSHRAGRPSKGERKTVSSRIAVPLAEAALGRAEDLGLSMSDYIASLIAHDNNLPQFHPHRTTAERGPAALVESASPAIVARLQEVLGRDLVAIITGKTPRQVSRWVSGEAKPPLDEQRVLRDTFQVVELLAKVEPDEVVRAWFIGMNPQLEDATPAEVIAKGRARDATAAARAFVSAG